MGYFQIERPDMDSRCRTRLPPQAARSLTGSLIFLFLVTCLNCAGDPRLYRAAVVLSSGTWSHLIYLIKVVSFLHDILASLLGFLGHGQWPLSDLSDMNYEDYASLDMDIPGLLHW